MRYFLGVLLGVFTLTVINPTILEAKHHKKHSSKEEKKEKKQHKKQEKQRKKEEKKRQHEEKKQRKAEERQREQQRQQEIEAKRHQWCDELGVSYDSQFGGGGNSSSSSSNEPSYANNDSPDNCQVGNETWGGVYSNER